LSNWQSLKRAKRVYKRQRNRAAGKLLPRLKEFCQQNEVEMLEVGHGYQFKLREYVLNWSPSTNKVQVQYRLSGHGNTVRFARAGQPGKPRVVVALEEMIALVRPIRIQARGDPAGPPHVESLHVVPFA
jgi:hypothetical protein